MTDAATLITEIGPASGDAVAPIRPTRRRGTGSTERSRHWRRRKAEGLRLLPSIEIKKAEVDLLVAKGLLREDERDSHRAITEAVYAVLEDAFQVLEIGAVPVELLDAEVALLIERGILQREERGDKYALAAALYRILEFAFAGLRDGSLKPVA